MKSILLKHTGVPIPDLGIRYEIDAPARIVGVHLERHLDSALLIDFSRRVLEESEGIKVIDNESMGTFGRAQIPDKYGIELHFCGLVFDAEIVRLGRWMEGPDASPVFTISMQKQDDNLPKRTEFDTLLS